MEEGAAPRTNPVELWKNWHDASFDAWSKMLGDEKESLADPFGLYRQWLNTLERDGDSEEIQRQWMDAPFGIWRRVFEAGAMLGRMAPHWFEMADETTKQMFEEGKPPTDPLDFYLRLYSATNAPISKAMRDVLEDENFLEDTRRFLENYASFEQVFQRAAEEYFSKLQLSTKADSERIASLVVALDAKVDLMEEAFEEFEDDLADPATTEAVSSFEARAGDLERKLDENGSDLRRLEEKLDRLLSVLDTKDGDERPDPPREVEATDAARRKARSLGVNLLEVEGSGAGGRITVEDVRREGSAG